MAKIDLKTSFSVKVDFRGGRPLYECSGLITAIAVAMATAMAMAAVIRPEHAEGGRNHENRFFIEKRCFRPILVILGPSRPQKWIRLEILH